MAGDAAGSVNLEQPPRVPTASAWAPGDWGQGHWMNGAPFHPPRPAAGQHSNVAPMRPEHGAMRSRGRMTHGVNQDQNSQPQTQSRSHRLGYIDEKWPEVMFINDYAVFIGYLSMAVTGTGFLVLTWSTVVLLGGFVTMLAKKDFWCLTVITLVQTRVFDVFLNEKISYIGYSFKRLWAALSVGLPQNPFRKWSVRGLIRVLVFTIVLCPLFALYTFGLFVSPVIALWRLIQQDYGDTARDSSKANLKPALVVLYSLALLQGVLFYYRAVSSLEEQRLLKLVAEAYGLKKDDEARGSISDYLREIRAGCEKDPSFGRGKNLVTYAAGLMQSSSPDNYLSGARIIDTLIQLRESMVQSENNIILTVRSASPGDNDATRNVVRLMRSKVAESVVESQRMLLDNMIGSASSGAIKKFVQMLDSSSQSDSTEIRLRAMRIVARFASEIRLSKIPYAIQCISSFLSKPEAHNHQGTIIYILSMLTEDQENLRLMTITNGLALNIIKMLADNQHIHYRVGENREHDRWCSEIALPGMKIIKRFTSVTKASNNMQLPREILESTNAVSTLQIMLECQQCKVQEELQKLVIMVLTQVTLMGTSLPVGDEVKKKVILSLIDIFVHGGNGNSSVKKLAGESMAQLSCVYENSATILGAENGRIVDSLTEVVLDQNSEYRKSAADILKHLCSNYTTNEQIRFPKLKDKMLDVDGVIPKVLKEVLGSRPTADPSRLLPFYYQYPQPPVYHPAAYNPGYQAPVYHPAYNPGYQPPVYHPAYNPGYPANFFSYNIEEQEALLSLCAIVHDRLIKQDIGLVATKFDQKANVIWREYMKIDDDDDDDDSDDDNGGDDDDDSDDDDSGDDDDDDDDEEEEEEKRRKKKKEQEELKKKKQKKKEVITFADLMEKAAGVVADNKRRSWTAGQPPMVNYSSYYENPDNNMCCIM